MLCLGHWNWRHPLGTRVISDCTTVWSCDALNTMVYTPSTMVCSEFTAARSLRNHFMAATDWTSLWFGLRVLIMVLSWSRQIQFGTHGFCSFSLPPHKPTPGPNRLTVLSCRRWKHMTILRMVITDIIDIIVIIVNICVLLRWLRLFWLWRLLWLLGLFSLLLLFMVGINWFASCIRARPQEPDSEIPIQSILGKLPFVPVDDTGTIPHHLRLGCVRHHFPGASHQQIGPLIGVQLI